MHIVLSPGDTLIIELSDSDGVIGIAYSDNGGWVVGTIADTEHPVGDVLFEEALVEVPPKPRRKRT